MICLLLPLLSPPGPPQAVQAPWPIYRGDPALSGVADCELSDDLAVRWTFKAGGAIASSPIVAEERVFFGSDDGNLYALDFETGENVWSFTTEDIVEAPPLYYSGTVYFGSSDYMFYAVDSKTGVLRWKHEAEDKFLGSATWAPGPDGKDHIIAGSYDTNLYCFEPATGRVVWKYATDNYVNGTPAVLDDLIVFGGCDAVLHCVSASTGEAAATLPLGDDCHVAGSVALADGRVYFGHYGNAFVCAEIAEPRVVWAYESERHAFFSSPAIGEDRVVFGGRDKNLHCARRDDGASIWTFRTRRKVDGSPVIAGDKVVFGSGDGWLYLLSLADGKELWRYEIGDSIFSSPAVVDGMILIGANDGSMYAFGPKDETEKR